MSKTDKADLGSSGWPWGVQVPYRAPKQKGIYLDVVLFSYENRKDSNLRGHERNSNVLWTFESRMVRRRPRGAPRRQPLYGSMAKEKTLKGDEIAEILKWETAKWVQTMKFLCFCKEFIFLVLNYDITKHRWHCYLPLLLSGLFLWIQNLRNSRWELSFRFKAEREDFFKYFWFL